jgi:Glycosyltransferase GT-D fold
VKVPRRRRAAAAADRGAPPTPAAQRSLDDVYDLLKDVRWELQQQRKFMEVYRLQLTRDVLDQVEDFTARQQLGFVDTMRRVIDEQVSFARFGDGEFKLIFRHEFNLRFQPWSPEISAELREVFTMDPDPRIMVGFPFLYRNLHWSGVWSDIWPSVQRLLRPDAVYGNSHVSRPVFFQQVGEAGVSLWREVWQDRDICVVTGRGSRFELLPELFDNVKSVTRIDSEPVDAYADLPRLEDQLGRSDPSALYLVSLGPAGTVVTAWLARQGRWAIDVGHISDSYINVFRGGKWPESLDVVRK